MTGKRRGLVSTINEYSIDELAEEMMVNPATKSKVRLYGKNDNMNKDTRVHAKLAYEHYKKLKKERRKAETALRAKERNESELEKRIAKWNEENPKSFRYRSVPEILELIANDPKCYVTAVTYMSATGSRSRSNPEMITRIRKALVSYYIIYEPSNSRLEKYLKVLNQE